MMLRPLLTPARRRRRRWAWTTATAVLAVVWVWSSQWALEWYGPSGYINVSSGGVGFRWGRVPQQPAPHVDFEWLSEEEAGVGEPVKWESWKKGMCGFSGTSGSGWWSFEAPLWLLLLPMLVPTARNWIARTIRPGTCERCGYDRTGLSLVAACPECGATPPAPPHSGHTTPAASPARS